MLRASPVCRKQRQPPALARAHWGCSSSILCPRDCEGRAPHAGSPARSSALFQPHPTSRPGRGQAAGEAAFAQGSSGQFGAGGRSPGALCASSSRLPWSLVLSWSCELYAVLRTRQVAVSFPGVARADGWDATAGARPSPSHTERGCLQDPAPGRLPIPLGSLRTTVTPPGAVSIFCCELVSYLNVENVFNFQLQPLDLILSLSARWDCVPFAFGIFARRKCPLQRPGSHAAPLLRHGIGNNPYRSDHQDCLLVFDHLQASCLNSCPRSLCCPRSVKFRAGCRV